MSEMRNIENSCAMLEEDKATKDGQICILHTEISHQEDMVSKLGKEEGWAARRWRRRSRSPRTGATTWPR